MDLKIDDGDYRPAFLACPNCGETAPAMIQDTGTLWCTMCLAPWHMEDTGEEDEDYCPPATD